MTEKSPALKKKWKKNRTLCKNVSSSQKNTIARKFIKYKSFFFLYNTVGNFHIQKKELHAYKKKRMANEKINKSESEIAIRGFFGKKKYFFCDKLIIYINRIFCRDSVCFW